MEITAKLVKELRELTASGMMDCKKALIETEGDIEKAVRWLQEQGIAKSAKKSGRIAAEGITKVYVDGNVGTIIELNAETDFVAKNEGFIELADEALKAIVKSQPADLEAALLVDVNGSTLGDKITSATATIGEKISLRRFTVLTKNDDEVFGQYVHFDNKKGVLLVAKGSEEFARNVAMQVASMNPLYVSQADMPQSLVQEQTEIQTEILSHDPVLSTKTEQQKAGIIKGRVNKALQDLSLLDQDYILDGNKKVSAYAKEQNASVITFVRYEVGEGMEKKEDNFAAEVASMTKSN